MTAPDSSQSAADERLQTALASANYRICLNNQKNNARVRLEKDLIYATRGGTFRVCAELISFVSALQQRGRRRTILIDVNTNPIEIDDIDEFLDVIIERYYECTNEFLCEMRRLQQSRTTAAVVGEK